jgi:hypothetical protein
MMEPQDHPNDFAYPGGPPVRPYDNAGWTLAYEMGVKFDRYLDPIEVPNTHRLMGSELAKPTAGTISSAQGAQGYLMSHEINDAVTVINRAQKAGVDVYWTKSPVTAGGKTFPAGTYYVSAAGQGAAVVQKAAQDLGVTFTGTTNRPGDAEKIAAKRIALYDQYGGMMPSGWTRLIFENSEIPYTVVYPKDIDAGSLKSKFDVLILPSGAQVRGAGGAGAFGGRGGGGGGGGRGGAPIPAEFEKMQGSLTPETSLPALKQFLNDGGVVITVGSATSLGYALDLPIENHLMVRAPGQAERPLAGEEYYVPGSILQVAVNNKEPVAAGMPEKLDVFFDNSPVFRLKPDASLKGVKAVAWFDSPTPLRSGWAWGQNYLEGGAAVLEANYGKGKLYMFGPEITFRGQPHGTFKFLFNGIYAPVGTAAVVP